MHGPLNVKIEKCAFKNISNVAVELNERRESVGNNCLRNYGGRKAEK
jgi:hypothetical protein